MVKVRSTNLYFRTISISGVTGFLSPLANDSDL